MQSALFLSTTSTELFTVVLPPLSGADVGGSPVDDGFLAMILGQRRPDLCKLEGDNMKESQ